MLVECDVLHKATIGVLFHEGGAYLWLCQGMQSCSWPTRVVCTAPLTSEERSSCNWELGEASSGFHRLECEVPRIFKLSKLLVGSNILKLALSSSSFMESA